MGMKKKIFDVIKVVILSIIMLAYVSPFALVAINSFKIRKEIIENPVGLAKTLSFDNFINAFEKMKFVSAFTNSFIITGVSVILIVLFSSMTAYYFVRVKTKLNNLMFFIMVASMIIPFQAIMIPLVSIYGKLGMLDNQGSLIFMYIGFGASLAVFMFHGFIKNIPYELEEAAMIDGCTKLQVYRLIIIPLIKPVMMTIVILDVLWIWNDFLLPKLVLQSPGARTLPLSTFYFFGTYSIDYGLLMAALMFSVVPVVILFVLLQKHIISGVMQGSFK